MKGEQVVITGSNGSVISTDRAPVEVINCMVAANGVLARRRFAIMQAARKAARLAALAGFLAGIWCAWAVLFVAGRLQ